MEDSSLTAADKPVLSCSADANPTTVDTCCVETFGGLVLSTQFWDTHTGLESQGQVLPKDSWTLHGLWPDFCNGSFTQYCDLNRQYDPSPSPKTTNGLPNGTVVPPYTGPNIGTFLEPFGKYDLLAYMNKCVAPQSASHPLVTITGTGSIKVPPTPTSGGMNFQSTGRVIQLLTFPATAPSTSTTPTSLTSFKPPFYTISAFQPLTGSPLPASRLLIPQHTLSLTFRVRLQAIMARFRMLVARGRDTTRRV